MSKVSNKEAKNDKTRFRNEKVKNTKTKDTKKKENKNSSKPKNTKPTAKNQTGKSSGKNHTKKGAPKKNNQKPKTLPFNIIPLGGIDEIGKNITAYEYGNDIIIVDCGMSFPDEDMPGIDIVIPDFSYLVQNSDRIKGLIVTHGHEDHIGGIPYLLKNINVPIYETPLTLGLIEGKLREHRLLESAKLIRVKPKDTVTLGAFTVEFIHVNHSVPNAVADRKSGV